MILPGPVIVEDCPASDLLGHLSNNFLPAPHTASESENHLCGRLSLMSRELQQLGEPPRTGYTWKESLHKINI